MKRLVTTENGSGRVVSEWQGGTEQTLDPRQGHTHRSVPNDGASYSGQRWNGLGFEPMPPDPIRVLSPLEFVRRFTIAEEIAIDALAETDRTVKVWQHRLSLATSVNLDHADVAAGLAYVKSVGIPSVWATEQVANRRIAEIRG